MQRLKKILLGVTLIFLALPIAARVFAVNLNVKYPTILGLSITSDSSIVQYATYFFSLGMFIGGLLAVMVLAIGGAYYLASFSRGKFVNEGREWVRAGVIGLLLLLCAYLIAYTINPDLVDFKIGSLNPVNLFYVPTSTGVTPPGDYIYYNEIPIGTLTETLMSKTMFCYDFDPEGNPIPMPLETDKDGKVGGPTYRDHDRVDCLLKLMDAAQKKAKILSDLAQELKKLMNTCKCDASKCGDPCNKKDKDGKDTGCRVAGKGCAGACKGTDGQGAACSQDHGDSCCTPDIKKKIEHGPVEVGCGAKNVFDNDQQKIFADLGIENNLLASFSNNSLFQLAQFLPPGQCNCGGGVIGTINPDGSCKCPGGNNGGGNNGGGNNGGGAACDGKCANPLRKFAGLDEFRTKLTNISGLIEKNVQVEKKDVAIINIDGTQNVKTQKKWSELKLVEQLMYFKEKIKQIEDDVKSDVNILDTARTAVANCYDVKSSVDFIKIKEGVRREDKIIVLPQPWSGADSSKYCKGFNFSNSSCYNICSKMCPDETVDVAKCYADAVKDECDPFDEDCLDEQQELVEECFDTRPCTNRDPGDSGEENPEDFETCLSTCQGNCSNFCGKTYLDCSDDYKLCQSQCSNNSECIFNNEDTCLINEGSINTYDFQKCLNKNDEGNIKNCVNNAYLCKHGSNEYAGYPDCTNGYTGCAPNLQLLKNPEYSSPYIFDNQLKQICPDPFKTCEEGINKGSICSDLYPKAAKCPSNSYCPDCPCGEVDQEIKFTIEDPNNPAPAGKVGGGSSTTISQKVSGHDLVTGECNEYSYSTDPLTFYCKSIFIETPILEGGDFKCSRANEIPVGQAVDDAKIWAKSLTDIADWYLGSITNIFTNVKKITDKKPNEYCRCDSKFDTGKPICRSNCLYNPEVWGKDDNGLPIKVADAFCSLTPCNGLSCQQMIDYMTQVSNDYVQMRKNFINLLILSLKDGRTDPLKELDYSRLTMSSCSVDIMERGINDAKTVSCTRAYHDSGFLDESCYGILKGKIHKPPLDYTDNWFCCGKINQ